MFKCTQQQRENNAGRNDNDSHSIIPTHKTPLHRPAAAIESIAEELKNSTNWSSFVHSPPSAIERIAGFSGTIRAAAVAPEITLNQVGKFWEVAFRWEAWGGDRAQTHVWKFVRLSDAIARCKALRQNCSGGTAS